MPRNIRSPYLRPWEAENDRYEEEYNIEYRIDDDKALCKPPQYVTMDRQKDP